MRQLALIATIVFLAASCRDIFEKKIDDQTVTLLVPADTVTTLSTFTFRWTEVEGAAKYNLQIVSPTFSYTNQILLDTNVTTTSFQFTLSPGSYEWGVKAFNNSSSTPMAIKTLRIDSTTDISKTQVIVVAPGNNSYAKSTTVLFQWQAIYNADNYTLTVKSPDWNGTEVLPGTIIYGNDTSLTLPEGQYEWGIQAFNSKTNTSSMLTKANVVIDITAPGVPTLSIPTANDTATAPFSFSWLRATDTGSPITKDSIYVSTDSTFKTSALIVTAQTSTAIYSYNGTNKGNLYWKVKSIDAAGNAGSFSGKRKVYVK